MKKDLELLENSIIEKDVYQRFFRFLKENDAFMEWSVERRHYIGGENRTCVFYDGDCQNYAAGILSYFETSFSWENTLNGWNYWNKLNRKWRRENEKNITN